MKSLKDIANEFSLKMPYVYRCVNEINLLKPHIQIGEKNKKFVNDDGVRIFDTIRRLKQEKLSLPEIKKQLDGAEPKPKNKVVSDINRQNAESKTRSIDHDSYQKVDVETLIDFYTNELRSAQERIQDLQDRHVQYVQEREQTIQELVRKNESLTGTLKALPAPDEYQQEQRKKQDAARILGELKSMTGLLKGKQRKALIEQLEKLL